jgi:hypothetical protein
VRERWREMAREGCGAGKRSKHVKVKHEPEVGRRCTQGKRARARGGSPMPQGSSTSPRWVTDAHRDQARARGGSPMHTGIKHEPEVGRRSGIKHEPEVGRRSHRDRRIDVHVQNIPKHPSVAHASCEYQQLVDLAIRHGEGKHANCLCEEMMRAVRRRP